MGVGDTNHLKKPYLILSKALKREEKNLQGLEIKCLKRLKGVPKTEEYKKKLSEIRKNSGKAILQYTLDGVFLKEWSNIDCVSKHYSCCRESIAGCCRGRRKTAIGYKWKYKN